LGIKELTIGSSSAHHGRKNGISSVGSIAIGIRDDWDVDTEECVRDASPFLYIEQYQRIWLNNHQSLPTRNCVFSILTLVVPHPETVMMVPAGGSNSEVGAGKLTGWAEATLRSNGVAT
jgi:hypothetical protein